MGLLTKRIFSNVILSPDLKMLYTYLSRIVDLNERIGL